MGRWDHPRLRGEYHGLYPFVLDTLGSPPLTRGIPRHAEKVQFFAGITPAYAGNTRRRECQRVMWWDHPRLRGEYRCREKVTLTQEGSPPLTRGIPPAAVQQIFLPGITPAYAGNTIPCIYDGHVRRDHPRLRGEYHTYRLENQVY